MKWFARKKKKTKNKKHKKIKNSRKEDSLFKISKFNDLLFEL